MGATQREREVNGRRSEQNSGELSSGYENRGVGGSNLFGYLEREHFLTPERQRTLFDIRPGDDFVQQLKQCSPITVVATSRSGGAFDFYGKLSGDNYTVYVDTPIGTVVMQFAEANPAAAPAHAGALTGPQGLRTNLPADLPHARIVIKGSLDASGNLRNLQVLEPGPAAMTAKVMAALPSWKFRPAMRGVQPVEVNAILGFNIDTNDR